MEGGASDQDLSRPAQAVRERRRVGRQNRRAGDADDRRRHRGLQGGAAASGRHIVHRRLRRWRLGMAELTYRDAVARGIAQEMTRDPDVIFFGEDVAKAGGVFKATVGLYEPLRPRWGRDCPISEQAILGAAMGAAMP